MAATIILSTKLNVAKLFIGVNHFFLFFKFYGEICKAQSKFRSAGITLENDIHMLRAMCCLIVHLTLTLNTLDINKSVDQMSSIIGRRKICAFRQHQSKRGIPIINASRSGVFPKVIVLRKLHRINFKVIKIPIMWEHFQTFGKIHIFTPFYMQRVFIDLGHAAYSEFIV
jgi:hypothetical protein